MLARCGLPVNLQRAMPVSLLSVQPGHMLLLRSYYSAIERIKLPMAPPPYGLEHKQRAGNKAAGLMLRDRREAAQTPDGLLLYSRLATESGRRAYFDRFTSLPACVRWRLLNWY